MEKNRDSGLDLLRCSAILMVLLLHSTQVATNMPSSLNYIFSYGWMGVDLFFVLSGYLIGTQAIWGKRSQKVKHNFHVFWAKRWFRTLPLYFFILFIYIYMKQFVSGKEFGPTIWPFFIFLQNYFPLTDFEQSWSICIEEQFYFILPFLSFLIFPNLVKRKRLWLLFIILAITIRLITSLMIQQSLTAFQTDYYFRFPLHTHFDGLAMGLFLASSHTVWGHWSHHTKRVCILMGLTLLFLTCWLLGPIFTAKNVAIYFSLLPLGFGLLLIGVQKLKISGTLLFFIHWIALLSYGTYLWNNLFIRALVRYFPNMHWAISILIFLLLTHLAAVFTYFLIEKPFLKLRSSYIKQYKLRLGVEADIFHTHHNPSK